MATSAPRFETVPPDGISEIWLYPAGLAAVLLLLAGWRIWRWRRAGLVLGFPGTRNACRWKRAGTREQLTEWQCKSCGIEAYSHDGKPPKECKKLLKAAL